MQLVGHINPTGVPNGFTIPVFEQPPANGLFIQKRTKRNASVELVVFDIDNVEGFYRIEEPIAIVPHEGEEYFSFEYQEEFIHGYHKTFNPDLIKIYPSLDRYPVLKFSVCRFLNLDADMPATFAVAYTHMRRTYSKEAANNWQDTQVYLPQILEALNNTPDNSRNSIERVEVKSVESKVEVTLITKNDFDFEYEPQPTLSKKLMTIDPDIDVTVITIPVSKAWEQIAESTEQINEDKMENELDEELRKLAVVYKEYDPEKRKKDADNFRQQLSVSLTNTISAKLLAEFNDKVSCQLITLGPSGKVDGMSRYGRGVSYTVAAITGGFKVRVFVYPVDVDRTLIAYGDATLASDLVGAVKKVEVENKNSELKVKELTEEIGYYVVRQFIRTFSSSINKLQ